jgi:hypothetical protein
VTIRRAGASLPNHHPFATENEQTHFFSTTTTLLPPKTSVFAHFWWWLLVCHLHHPFTIENERICLFSMVRCFNLSPALTTPENEQPLLVFGIFIIIVILIN